jgi:hypothetical protein
MPPRRADKPPPTAKPVKTNEKGEIISWNSNSKDGQLLKLLLEQGHIKKETAMQVQQDYPNFKKYALKTLNSALASNRKALEKAVDERRSDGNAGEWFLVLLLLERDWTMILFCFILSLLTADCLFCFHSDAESQQSCC